MSKRRQNKREHKRNRLAVTEPRVKACNPNGERLARQLVEDGLAAPVILEGVFGPRPEAGGAR